MSEQNKKWIPKVAFGLVICILIAGQLYFSNFSKSESTMLNEKAKERALLIGKKLIDAKFQRKIFTESTAQRSLAADTDFVLTTAEEGQAGRDPWGQPFTYKKQGDRLTITSLGANRDYASDDLVFEMDAR